MTDSDRTISPLRRRMTEDMTIRGLAMHIELWPNLDGAVKSWRLMVAGMVIFQSNDGIFP
jgi:hypothetical protein